MLAHYFTLEALARELRALLAGSTLIEGYTQAKDELMATLESADGSQITLVVSVAPGRNALFTRRNRMRAKRNSMDIFPQTFGSRLADIRVDEFSRVVTIGLERDGSGGTGAGWPHALKVHLFNNAASNVFLVSAGGAIESTFTSSTKAPGSRYEPPGDRRPGAAGDAGPDGAPAEPDLKSRYPWLGPLYLREARARAGSDSAGAIEGAVKEMLGEVRLPGARLYDLDLPEPRQAPFDRPVLSVIELRQPGARLVKSFESVDSGVRETYSALRSEEGLGEEKAGLLAAVEKEIRRTGKALGAARAKAGDPPEAARWREAGGLILTHISSIRKGQTEARLTDAAGLEVVVMLDRSLPPAANADAYFEKARKADAAIGENRSRIGTLEAKLVRLQTILSELEACSDVRAVRELRKRLASGGAPIVREPAERLPYRVFPLGADFEAWVGKSSADNDELTFKHAGPHDYWMHVRGASGSHVVIRQRSGGRSDPPKDVIRAAARIAAHYSKMKRARMVPVAYCQRKYVRKPKHAPPGTVSVQREEVIFVEPGLPGEP